MKEIWLGVIGIISSLGLGGWISTIIIDKWRRNNPTSLERAEERKILAEARKTINESNQLDLAITEQVKKSLEIETAKYSDLFFKRELEHQVEVNTWKEKLIQANRKIEECHYRIEDYVLKIKAAHDEIQNLKDTLQGLEKILELKIKEYEAKNR